MNPLKLPSQKSWEHQIWHAGTCSPKFLEKICFKSITSSLCRHRHAFEKRLYFCDDATGDSKIYIWLFFLMNHKMRKPK